jgi:hypothetical protein
MSRPTPNPQPRRWSLDLEEVEQRRVLACRNYDRCLRAIVIAAPHTPSWDCCECSAADVPPMSQLAPLRLASPTDEF